MKIYKELIQGTDEWLSARLGKVTGSTSSVLMNKTEQLTKGAETYALKIIGEQLTGIIPEHYTSKAMEQGTLNESLARKVYEAKRKVIVTEVGGIEEGILWYSPDGLVNDDGLIEIKCPEPTQHIRNLMNDNVNPEYYHQLQFGLLVTKRKWIDFISFNMNFPSDKIIKIIRVYPDKEYHAKFERKLVLFNQLLNKIKTTL